MMLRAKRDAVALHTPLILVQAADVSTPTMPLAAAKKLMNVANPKDSGNMHVAKVQSRSVAFTCPHLASALATLPPHRPGEETA